MSDLFEEIEQIGGGKKPQAQKKADLVYDQNAPKSGKETPVNRSRGVSMDVKPYELPDLNRGKLAVVEDDPYLQHYENDIKHRVGEFLR